MAVRGANTTIPVTEINFSLLTLNKIFKFFNTPVGRVFVVFALHQNPGPGTELTELQLAKGRKLAIR